MPPCLVLYDRGQGDKGTLSHTALWGHSTVSQHGETLQPQPQMAICCLLHQKYNWFAKVNHKIYDIKCIFMGAFFLLLLISQQNT